LLASEANSEKLSAAWLSFSQERSEFEASMEARQATFFPVE
jgi:hypothetical protein